MSIKHEIRNFFTDNPFYAELVPPSFADDFALLDTGVLDSIGIFYLIIFLEKQFQIKVGVEDLSKANFNSLNEIENLVKAKSLFGFGARREDLDG